MFSLDDVRYYAQVYGWQEVQFNDVSKVIGFVRKDQRVNVYWTTGTVGTCVNHPSKGKTQLFRRNQTVKDLIKILQNPRVHTGAGYYRRSTCNAREPSARIIGGICCSLASEQLQNELVKSYDAKTVQVALGAGYFAVQQDGSTWWRAVPVPLHNKVYGRRTGSPHRSAVDYVALGPNGQYYVAFEDGTWGGLLPTTLVEELRSSSRSVSLLALAPDSCWYVKYDDGGSTWQGIPMELHHQLKGRYTSLGPSAAAATVEDLAIGPKGEWWVRYANGAWKARNITTCMSNAIEKLKAQGADIAGMRFGEDHTWAIMY